MIALLISLFTLAFGLYIKYRFHIQFALLLRKGYKYLESRKETNGPRH